MTARGQPGLNFLHSVPGIFLDLFLTKLFGEEEWDSSLMRSNELEAAQGILD